MPVTVGSQVPLKWTPGGHSATLTVIKPDGTVLTPAPTVTATAEQYSATFDTDQVGRYVIRLDVTSEDRSEVDILDVWPIDPRYLISVDDAATALRWRPQDREANLPALALYVAAATEVIEDITGAILIRTIVQPSDGGRSGVMLWERPDSITSVTVGGSAFTGYVTNYNAAIVYADGAGGRFPDGRQNVVITYVTGTTAVPPSIQLAARELIRHLWQVGQQALTNGQPSYDSNGQPAGLTRSGFAVPKRVIELCGNHHALPGIA